MPEMVEDRGVVWLGACKWGKGVCVWDGGGMGNKKDKGVGEDGVGWFK